MSISGIRPEDRVLDRVDEKDERSRGYGVMRLVPTVPTKSKAHRTGKQLDQGNTGHCGAFSAAAEVSAAPYRIQAHIDNEWAHAYYYEIKARRLDPFGLEDGTSTLAVMKLGVIRGFWESYSWGFSVDDVKRGLEIGPGLLGVNWWTKMFYPNEHNVIFPGGSLAGGHLFLIRRWTPRLVVRGYNYGEAYHIRNSWGGDVNAWITRETLQELLVNQRGEYGIPVNRQLIPAVPRAA